MKSPWFSLNHISHLATVEIRVVRLGSFQNLYLSFAIVEITHGVTANRDDKFRQVKPVYTVGEMSINASILCKNHEMYRNLTCESLAYFILYIVNEKKKK